MRFLTLEESGLSEENYVKAWIGVQQKSKESFYYFYKTFFEAFVPAKFIDNFHIKIICDECQIVAEKYLSGESSKYDLVVNVPPGESKSSIISVAYPVWLWLLKSNMRIMTTTHSSSLSEDHLAASRSLIRDNMFQGFFGELFKINYRDDSRRRYSNNKQGFRKTNYIGAKIIGKHADIHIIDDPIDPQGLKSDKIISDTLTYIDEVLSTRVTDKSKTPFILVMQRLHENDPTGHWLRNRNVKHICLPATIDHPIHPPELIDYYTDGVMNPHRTGVNVLQKFKKLLGTRQYFNQFGQETSASEGNIILTKWFEVRTLDKIPHDLWEYPVMFYSDTGDKDKEDSDPTGMLACIYHPTGILFLIDYVEWVCRFSERVRNMKDVFNLWGGPQSQLKIEAKSSGVSVKDVLVSEPYNVNAMEWVGVSGSKEYRARLCEGVFEAGRVKIVKDVARKWVDDFLLQLKLFPNAAHDECVDVLTMATIDEVLRRLPAFDRQWIGLG